MSAATKQAPEGQWQIEGGERIGGINVLPRWSIFTEEFPDTTGLTGTGVVCYSKRTFAFLNADEATANHICRAVNAYSAAQKLAEACKIALLKGAENLKVAEERRSFCRAALAAWEEANKP